MSDRVHIRKLSTGEVFVASSEDAAKLVATGEWKRVSVGMPKVHMKGKGSYTPPMATT